MGRGEVWARSRNRRLQRRWSTDQPLKITKQSMANMIQTGDIDQLKTLLSPLISSASTVHTDISLKPSASSVFSRFFSSPTSKSEGFAQILGSSKVQPLQPIINDLRAFKSDAEIRNMRKAGQASGRAFTETMRQSWTKEKDLGAFLEYRFKAQGCDGSAYVPVIAGGKVRGLPFQTTDNSTNSSRTRSASTTSATTTSSSSSPSHPRIPPSIKH